MKKLSTQQKEKVKAALELLCEDNTTLDKIQKLSTLLKGTNPKIDSGLKKILDIASELKKVQEGDVITLSAEKLPEDNEKNRKRKKLILLLLSTWKDLGSEINRISEVQTIASTTGIASKEAAVKTGKILATAKGPLGVVTIIAAGVVAVSTIINKKSVDINVKNIGCRPLEPVIEQKVNLPGLKLPSKAIENGDTGVVTILSVDFNLDNTEGSEVVLTFPSLNISRSFNIPSEIKDISYDGESIIGKSTQIKLSDSKTHEVVIRCSGKAS